ncbi:hypothetical protein [Allochromatium tepidum]|uniref:hypothetical protein n=1 Tax=Allochromatium tepidum TaxID=553982 RepID=UPI001F22642E|nr:hypothetical protein [Allochromatium tepidum]
MSDQMIDDNEMKPAHSERERRQKLHQELPVDFPDPFFRVLHRIIRFAIRILSVLMVAGYPLGRSRYRLHHLRTAEGAAFLALEYQ